LPQRGLLSFARNNSFQRSIESLAAIKVWTRGNKAESFSLKTLGFFSIGERIFMTLKHLFSIRQFYSSYIERSLALAHRTAGATAVAGRAMEAARPRWRRTAGGAERGNRRGRMWSGGNRGGRTWSGGNPGGRSMMERWQPGWPQLEWRQLEFPWMAEFGRGSAIAERVAIGIVETGAVAIGMAALEPRTRQR